MEAALGQGRSLGGGAFSLGLLPFCCRQSGLLQIPASRGLVTGADLVAVAGTEAVTSGGEPAAVQGEAGYEEGGLGGGRSGHQGGLRPFGR